MRSLLSLAPGEFASDRMFVFMNAKCWDGSWLLESLTASPPVTDVTDNSASLSRNSVLKTGQLTLCCPGKSAMFNFYKQRRRSTNLYQSSFSSSIELSPSSSSDSESTSTSVSASSRGASGVTLLVGGSSSGSPLLNPLIVFYQFRRKLF